AARRMEPAGGVLSALPDDQPFQIEEQIFIRAVVFQIADLVLRDRIERVANRPRVGRGHDAAIGEHHQVGVVDRHERREKEPLGVLEVFVEYAGDVLGREPHERSIARNYLKYAPSTAATTDRK